MSMILYIADLSDTVSQNSPQDRYQTCGFFSEGLIEPSDVDGKNTPHLQ